MSWRGQRRPVSVLAEMALRKERVAERLSDLRERGALSQEQAAAKVGVTLRQWQRWEAGESVPYPRNLDSVASAFGISVAEFFDEPQVVVTPDVRQLDRIQADVDDMRAKLDELLDLLRPAAETLAAAFEAEADRLDEQRKPPAAKPKRTRRSAPGR